MRCYVTHETSVNAPPGLFVVVRESDKAATDLAASVAYASGGAMVEEPLRTRPDLT